MITKYKLFESNELKNPWSEYYQNKYPKLKKLYDSLDIEIVDNEEWVILHHFTTADIFNPRLDYPKIIKEKILSKYGDKYNILEEEMNKLAHKPIDIKNVENFLTYPRFELDYFHLNTLVKLLGFPMYEDFVKSIDDEMGDSATGSLDPQFFGTASATRDDHSQLAFSVIMFYVDLKDKEGIFSGYDYVKIRYPLSKLYPMFKDPFHYYSEGSNSVKPVMEGARNDGFNGDIANWTKKGEESIYRCDIWEKIPLTFIENGKIKQSKYLIEYKKA
jgi:hypothetical protein